MSTNINGSVVPNGLFIQDAAYSVDNLISSTNMNSAGTSGINYRPSGYEEGLVSGAIDTDDDGVVDFTGYYTSRTNIQTLDLISEGPIDGLVSGDYEPFGVIGEIGYRTMDFQEWETGDGVTTTLHPWLRSVYFNETPVANEKGQLNYQQVGVSTFDGAASGIGPNDQFLNNVQESRPSRTRTISERLYGPDRDPNANASVVDDSANVYYPKVYRIINPECNKLAINFRIPALSYTKYGDEFEQDEQGQIVGSNLNFAIEYRPIYEYPLGSQPDTDQWTDVSSDRLGIQGLLSQAYMHTVSFSLTADTTEHLKGWEIRVKRLTADSITFNITNQSFIDTITEFYEQGFSYPNSSLVSCLFRSDYFGQVPNRAFDMRLQKVKVPVGYDPETRSYSTAGDPPAYVPWEGDFQTNENGSWDLKWTDNPAWIFYDLITNKRYGLGKYVPDVLVDKWTLYKIGQYCDVLVDNGEGGYEPRFSCNVLINTREEAYKVLKDFASIFRGMLYYGVGSIQATQDSPREPVLQFTNGNVLDGNFNYSSTSKKVRPSVCLVRYNEKTNFYKPAIEYVEDSEAIRKYGIREKEVTAFGCTSRGQAIRLGRWLLYTDNWETDVVSFTCGGEGMLLRPGDLVKIADKYKGLGTEGGRTVSAGVTGVFLDRVAAEESSNYILSLTTPSYFFDTSLVKGVPADPFDSSDIPDIRRSHVQSFKFHTSNTAGVSVYNTIIGSGSAVAPGGGGSDGPIYGTVIKYPEGTFDTSLFNVTGDEDVSPNIQAPEQLVWTLEKADSYEPEHYRIINVKEDEDSLRFAVEAAKFHSGKFAAVDEGIVFTPASPSTASSAAAPPDPVSLDLYDEFLKKPDGSDSSTKQLVWKVEQPSPATIGTTYYYQVWAKTGSAFSTEDFKEGSSVPRDQFKEGRILKSNNTNFSSGTFIPRHNDKTYHALAYAVNNVGIYSSNHKISSEDVEDHYPVRDVVIDSLRLKSNQSEEGSAGAGAKPYFIADPQGKDHNFTWRATHAYAGAYTLPLEYKVTIRKPSASNVPWTAGPNHTDVRLSRIVGENQFSFHFDLNKEIQGGPFRHYDVVVEAIDPNSLEIYPNNSSTGSCLYTAGATCDGYDILEVHDPRPSGFNLTPRVMHGTRPGSCFGGDKVCTQQHITSDGLIYLDIRNNYWKDLAGGTLYLSASGFDTGDFIGGQHGTPDHAGRKAGIVDDVEIAQRQIVEVPFEAHEAQWVGADPLMLTPMNNPDAGDGNPMPIDINYTMKYYMAASFYDKFDKARKDDGDANYDAGQYVAFARPATGVGGASDIIPGCNTTGNPAPDINGNDAVCVYPSKYFSSHGMNPFQWWIRLNVNGQWEGHGISMVRVLTKKDVNNYYAFDGFYDYTCKMVERLETVDGNPTYAIYPNDYWLSRSVCRFTQGEKLAGAAGAYGDYWHKPDLHTRYYDNQLDRWEGQNLTGLKTGIPAPSSGLENIRSYDEFGEESINILGQKLTRPLHGYRRFRCYFDRHNLPPSGEPGRPAPYSVIGFNSWNGVYESWPGDYSAVTNDPELLNKSLFFAREWAFDSLDGQGNLAFPKHTVQTWMNLARRPQEDSPAYVAKGDLFENIPGVWNHHSAGFGAGFGGLLKTQRYFDVHLGRLIDDSYLEEALFAVASSNDYSIKYQSATFSNIATGGAPALAPLLDMSMFTDWGYTWYIDESGFNPANYDYSYNQ